MLPYLFSEPLIFIAWGISLVVAVTVHEFAHAYAADKLGDPTPRIDGRVTLNPLAHLDPIGTVMMLFFRFGWGKPVVFDPYNLPNPKRDTAIISFAGPLSNLIMASIAALIYNFVPVGVFTVFLPLFVILNVTLAIFNLVPVHPLDGGKILVGILPRKESHQLDLFLRQYGTYLLLALILPFWNGRSLVFSLISPIIDSIVSIMLPNFLQYI